MENMIDRINIWAMHNPEVFVEMRSFGANTELFRVGYSNHNWNHTGLMDRYYVDGEPLEFVVGKWEKSINSITQDVETASQKQLSGKLTYTGRVDVRACTEGIAMLRSKAIDELKKYPESMSWPDITQEQFLDAMYRHTMAMVDGGVDSVDPETGLPHLYAVQFNAMVLAMKFRDK